MCQVEGEEYRRHKSIESFGPCSFDVFLEVWQKGIAACPEWKELGKDEVLSVDGNRAIYSLGGYNRYSVLWSGEIVFLWPLARLWEDINKARRVGFRIY